MDKKVLFQKIIDKQKFYDKYFLNKEFIYIYEEKGVIKEFNLKFNKSNFRHLTGVGTKKLGLTAIDFYKNIKKGNININKLEVTPYTALKLNNFEKLTQIIYAASIYYNFNNSKGNSNHLYIDSMISEIKGKQENSIILGITLDKKHGYVPASLLYHNPEKIGKKIGKVLLVGEKSIKNKSLKYKTLFRISNIKNIPEDIKNKFIGIENYNCLTGNNIEFFQHKNGENKWIAKKDVKINKLKTKENVVAKNSFITNKEEKKIYGNLISYYNLEDVFITEEFSNKIKIKKEEKEWEKQVSEE